MCVCVCFKVYFECIIIRNVFLLFQVDECQEHYSRILELYCRTLYPTRPEIFPKSLGKSYFLDPKYKGIATKYFICLTRIMYQYFVNLNYHK